MKVKLRTIYGGPNGCFDAGAEIELPDAEAVELLNGGYAEPVGAVPETAATTGGETTAQAEPKPAPKPKAPAAAPAAK